jgi:hypothetical protein
MMQFGLKCVEIVCRLYCRFQIKRGIDQHNNDANLFASANKATENGLLRKKIGMQSRLQDLRGMRVFLFALANELTDNLFQDSLR